MSPCELFLDNTGFVGDVLAAVFGGVIDLADGERTTFGGLESIFLTTPFVFTAAEDSVTFGETVAFGDTLTGDFKGTDFDTALSELWGDDNTAFGGVVTVKQVKLIKITNQDRLRGTVHTLTFKKRKIKMRKEKIM